MPEGIYVQVTWEGDDILKNENEQPNAFNKWVSVAETKVHAMVTLILSYILSRNCDSFLINWDT